MVLVSSYESVGWRDFPENSLSFRLFSTEDQNALLPKVVMVFHDININSIVKRWAGAYSRASPCCGSTVGS